MNDNTIKKYIDSFSADTITVPTVINQLLTDLNTLNYPGEEIDEIVLSMDEALTNAIQETIRKNYNIHYGPETREITVMYIITMDEFEAVVIDQGKGLNLQESIKETPDKTASNYFDQIAKYSSKAEKGL
ncbi:MAG TPA: ATP-binding protein, partial [Spirochaetota bacterium]|nr:ATP-binding protein [Spirochaetota bacterium]